MHDAARNGDEEAIINMLNVHGSAAAFEKDKLERQPIHLAAYAGHLNVCKLLINLPDAHVDIFAQDNMTPLNFAIMKNNYEICEFLIENKANVNSKTIHKKGFKSLMHFVAKGGNLQIAKLLVDNGAKVLTLDKFNKKPIDYAADEDMIEYLKAEGEREEKEEGEKKVELKQMNKEGKKEKRKSEGGEQEAGGEKKKKKKEEKTSMLSFSDEM